MDTYEIKDDILTKTTTTEITYNKKEIEAELLKIESEIKDVSKEPDQILIQNDAKFERIDSLNNKKAELEALLAQWQ